MPSDEPDGLAAQLYAEAEQMDAMARRIRASAVWLRLTHERAASQTLRANPVQPIELTLQSASEGPWCDECKGPYSHCLGRHP